MIVDFGLNENAIARIQKMLYLNLLNYTKGESHSRVIAGGTKDAMETYRYINHKGKNSNIISLMEKRTKVMNPDQASRIEEVEGKMMMWKEDRRYLMEANHKQDQEMIANDEQMCTILLNLVSEKSKTIS